MKPYQQQNHTTDPWNVYKFKYLGSTWTNAEFHDQIKRSINPGNAYYYYYSLLKITIISVF